MIIIIIIIIIRKKKIVYEFGKRWRYCTEKQIKEDDGKQIYINLKEELLNNNINTITFEQYLLLQEKAHEHKNTIFYKKASWISNIAEGSLLTTSHLMAIMIYCNFMVVFEFFVFFYIFI